METIILNGKKYYSEQVQEPISQYKIFRGDRSGVFFGLLKERSEDGKRVLIGNARRIWYWDGAASLSQLAQSGTSKPENCKFPEPVTEIELTDVIEILSVTEKAKESIDGVAIWEK